jgi:hypothetical protein
VEQTVKVSRVFLYILCILLQLFRDIITVYCDSNARPILRSVGKMQCCGWLKQVHFRGLLKKGRLPKVDRPRENSCGGMTALVRLGGMFTIRWTRELLFVGSMTRQRLVCCEHDKNLPSSVKCGEFLD